MVKRIAYVQGLGQVVQSDGNLSTNVQELKRKGGLISPRDEAYARIHTSKKEQIGKSEGTRISALVYCIEGDMPVIEVKPKIITPELADLLVKARSKSKYYSSGTTKEYDSARKRAEKQIQKGFAPEMITAMICPSRDNFSMSLTENPAFLKFLIEDAAADYIQLNKGPITFYPIGKKIVDGEQPELLTCLGGTIQNYLWFGSLDDRSGLDGGSRDASYYGYGARGVINRSAEGASQKIVRSYTTRDVDKELRRISKLEAELEKSRKFLESLKR